MDGMRSLSRRIVRAATAFALVLPMASCGTLVRDPRPSIVMIVIDTLRADYLGSYGFEGPISPHIDRLASESVVFESCWSQAPWTTPSVASMMTSQWPDLYGVLLPRGAPRDHSQWRRQWNPAVPASATTLAESLRASGYRTAAFVANPFLIDGLGFSQGFDVFDARRARAADRSAQRLLEDSASWLGEAMDGGSPYFLYLHLMDVHGPYTAHPRHVVAVEDSPGLGADHTLSNAEYDRIQPYLRKPRWARQPGSRSVRQWRARYAAGIHAADHQLGELFERLRSHPRWSNTVVVVTSDHGEELFDHGGWDHGFSLYQHQLHVPLILRNPTDSQPARRVTSRVGLVDLMPTLLALAGQDAQTGLAGRDLFGPRSSAPRPLFASCNKDRPDEATVVVGPFKLITDLEAGSRRLFNLAQDPHEIVDLSTTAVAETAELQSVLETVAASRRYSAAGSQPLVELSDEQLESLRELGYVD
jgi:arylsulfatase A-like enzyme